MNQLQSRFLLVFTSEIYHMQMQPHPPNQLLHLLRMCDTEMYSTLPIQPCMLHVAVPNNHIYIMIEDFLYLNSLCQHEFIVLHYST